MVVNTALEPFYDYVLNGKAAPSVDSVEYFYWKCPVGPDHIFLGKPKVMLGQFERDGKVPCPHCENTGVQGHYTKGGHVPVSNSLATCCLTTGFLRPLNEWHPLYNGNLTPLDVELGNHKTIVWWKAESSPDHVFSTNIRERLFQFKRFSEIDEDVFSSATDIPASILEELREIMSGNKAKRMITLPKFRILLKARTYVSIKLLIEPKIVGWKQKQLSITNSFFGVYPHLRNQFHPLFYRPGMECQYTQSEAKERIWWKCDDGPDHVWPASPLARNQTDGHSNGGCWYCASNDVSEISRFKPPNDGTPQGISITNSVAGHRAFEHQMWGKNVQIPELVRYGSSKKPCNWVCLAGRGHGEWSAVPNNRLNSDGTLGSGCLPCFEEEKHRAQENLRNLIRVNFPWLRPSDRPRNAFGLRYNGKKGRKMVFDITLRADIPHVIEYQSEIHDQVSHGKYRGEKGLDQRKDRDEKKRLACNTAKPKVNMIEVWYHNSKSCPVTWDGSTVESLVKVFEYFNFDPYQYQ